MKPYENLTAEAITTGAIKQILSTKEPSEWTEYDVLLADRVGMMIPDGLMPKELFFLKLISKETIPGCYMLIARSEAKLYMEEAVDCVIQHYRPKWIDHFGRGDSAKERSYKSRLALIQCFEEMVRTDEITVTWKNVRTLLNILDLQDTEVCFLNKVSDSVRAIAEKNGEEIPNDISEWFADI